MIHSIVKKFPKYFTLSLRDFRQKIVAIQCMHFHSLDCHVASLLAMTRGKKNYSRNDKLEKNYSRNDKMKNRRFFESV